MVAIVESQTEKNMEHEMGTTVFKDIEGLLIGKKSRYQCFTLNGSYDRPLLGSYSRLRDVGFRFGVLSLGHCGVQTP